MRAFVCADLRGSFFRKHQRRFMMLFAVSVWWSRGRCNGQLVCGVAEGHLNSEGGLAFGKSWVAGHGLVSASWQRLDSCSSGEGCVSLIVSIVLTCVEIRVRLSQAELSLRA